MSAPLALTQSEHGCVEAAERTEDEEHVCVGGAVVDGGGHVGDTDLSACAGGDVDLVVAGTLEQLLGRDVKVKEEKKIVIIIMTQKLRS